MNTWIGCGRPLVRPFFEVVDDDMTNSIVFACKGDLLDDPGTATLTRPAAISKDAWRQLMPTLRVIDATLELR